MINHRDEIWLKRNGHSELAPIQYADYDNAHVSCSTAAGVVNAVADLDIDENLALNLVGELESKGYEVKCCAKCVYLNQGGGMFEAWHTFGWCLHGMEGKYVSFVSKTDFASYCDAFSEGDIEQRRGIADAWEATLPNRQRNQKG
jgi:hypothetical protein